ncbi:hypothetical protein [Alkalilimnicola sp. S0819]|uniref:hypothetical protein n=1 Tax=Alkalilimnicola sp. S0819 TaxID=2613922 RepID=UPI001261B394|nr:hypothetical protein [Alkalilimnicola sp. S0819]KAB7619538.1 hypothetical protein F3N43_13470 [Alkalilimnicola sp. S0819]MPQ17645.1 hypothetical protein [Alkalilimnicola sp. S0819]
MSNRGLAVLCVRLFAIALVVYMLYALPHWYARSADLPAGFFHLLLPVYLLGTVLAAWMWWSPGRLASLMLPQRSSESASGTSQEGQPPSSDETAAVLLFCAGFLLALWVLPEFLVGVWRVFTLLGEGAAQPLWAREEGILLLGRGGQFLLAVWLCLGRRGWLGAWRRLRRAGAY